MKPQVYANKTLVIRVTLCVGFTFFVFYHGNKSRLSVLLVLFGHYLWNYFGLCLILWNNMYLLRYFIRVKHCGWLQAINIFIYIFFIGKIKFVALVISWPSSLWGSPDRVLCLMSMKVSFSFTFLVMALQSGDVWWDRTSETTILSLKFV